MKCTVCEVVNEGYFKKYPKYKINNHAVIIIMIIILSSFSESL